MSIYQIATRSGLRVRVVAETAVEAGRIFTRENPGEEILCIQYKRKQGPGPKTTKLNAGKRVLEIPDGYYRVRSGVTQAGDLAFWLGGIQVPEGWHPVDIVPPGYTNPINTLGHPVKDYHAILRKYRK